MDHETVSILRDMDKEIKNLAERVKKLEKPGKDKEKEDNNK